jgi:hypothetical protein
MKPSDFYTVPASEAGIKLPLLMPDGTDSGHWIMVKGPDSLAYRKSMDVINRRRMEIMTIEDFEERERVADDVLADSRAPLVMAWSFDEPLTIESAREFLKNAPLIARQIEQASGDRRRFTNPGSPNSTSGPGSSENSEAAAEKPSTSDSAFEPTAPASLNTSSDTGEISSQAA